VTDKTEIHPRKPTTISIYLIFSPCLYMSSATYLERTFAHCSLVYVYTDPQKKNIAQKI
jgi:hypothetical protein